MALIAKPFRMCENVIELIKNSKKTEGYYGTNRNNM